MKNKKLFAILTLVCFMMTLMPVAAFAAGEPSNAAAVSDMSIFTATNGDDTISAGVTTVEFTFKIRDNSATETSQKLENVYIWAEAANGTRSSALTLKSATIANANLTMDATYNIYGPFEVSNLDKVVLSFARTGTFKVYAGTFDKTNNQTITNAVKLIGSSEMTVITTNQDPEDVYRAELDATQTAAVLNPTPNTVDNTVTGVADTHYIDTITGVIGSVDVTPNNVAEKVVVKFHKLNQAKTKYSDLAGKTVSITTNSANITVNKETATTNVLGQIDFKLSAAREGTYKVYLEVDGVQFELTVNCGNTSAAYIETVSEPENAVAQYSNLGIDKDVEIEFAVTDINGNTVENFAKGGMAGIQANATNGKYITLVSKPSGASLTDKDLTLKYDAATKTYYLTATQTLDTEGTYEVRVILDNGAYATAKFEVKKFGTPVQLKVTYKQEAVELAGTAVLDELIYLDANGVQKNAKDATLAASGYAISAFYANATKVGSNDVAKGTIVVKADEKYVGSEITVTAVSSRYNLIDKTTVKVTADAAELAFASKTAEVNVNNKIDVQIVDADGNKVAPTNVVDTEIYYVVLDKPEDAKVSVYTSSDKDLADKGKFTMALTSNKIGNVAVQAVAKLTIQNYNTTDSTTVNNTVVKYYTGTQIFAVGNGSVGDVVVMSIGSHEVIVNDKKATIDAAPMIQNDRTFVPFRALAEAFGAEVAYDEATQAVTAKLNGVEVVMTIGSATYTVNGAEKTMDVAPFINGSRTMVPVRFAAEAFGIKVIPTYNPDGTTADILFNL